MHPCWYNVHLFSSINQSTAYIDFILTFLHMLQFELHVITTTDNKKKTNKHIQLNVQIGNIIILKQHERGAFEIESKRFNWMLLRFRWGKRAIKLRIGFSHQFFFLHRCFFDVHQIKLNTKSALKQTAKCLRFEYVVWCQLKFEWHHVIRKHCGVYKAIGYEKQTKKEYLSARLATESMSPIIAVAPLLLLSREFL